jgi:glycosyltransferase involved in cell wall biosynthesis
MGAYHDEVGGRLKNLKRTIKTIENLGIRDRVIFTGYTSNEEFNAIMNGALAVVNPSLYEGFGMPVAEAMLLEKPVVCSNVASLPEIGGNAALYFDPYDTDDMAEKLYQVYSDPKLRQDMIEKGKTHVKNFTNKEKMLKDMSDLLDKVIEETANDKYKIDWDFCSLK